MSAEYESRELIARMNPHHGALGPSLATDCRSRQCVIEAPSCMLFWRRRLKMVFLEHGLDQDLVRHCSLIIAASQDQIIAYQVHSAPGASLQPLFS